MSKVNIFHQVIGRVGELLKTKLLLNETIQSIYFFFDFDDTLFARDEEKFNKLMLEGKYEQAYQLPKEPLPNVVDLLNFLIKQNCQNLFIITKQSATEDIELLLSQYNLNIFRSILCQRNEYIENNQKTRSVTKGEVIVEFLMKEDLLKLNGEPRDNVKIGIIFVDDIQENIDSVHHHLADSFPLFSVFVGQENGLLP